MLLCISISKASMYSCIMSIYHVMNNVYISVVLSIDGTDIDIAINVISGSASPKLGLLTTDDRLTDRAANDMANVFSFLDAGASL